METRIIAENDISGCLEIYNYYVKSTTVSLEHDEVSIDEYKKRVNDILKKYPFIVLKDNNRVLGFAYLSPFNYRKGYDLSADLSIYVDKDHLKKGYGQILFDDILIKAKELKLNNIISLVTSENMNSIKFHEKNGFSLQGNLKKVAIKFGREVDLLLFNKNLRENNK